ncbi:MAG: type I toxin-antitoxin system SymE family toxin [Deltaproteobacteria bacterium]|nr:type I toxin-antitoxin system SymE family toxin [Deltaproteobacteria bacterium]
MAVRLLSITRKPGGNPNHPFINLSGKWLKENGFEIGDKVLIEGRKGNLQIRAIQFLEQEDDKGCKYLAEDRKEINSA